MKWFIILLILGGIGYGVYTFKDDILELVNGDKDKGGTEQPGTTTPGSGDEKPPATDGGNNNPPPKRPKPPETVDPIAKRYPMPVFKPIEELVGNWNEVPPSAFPRDITVNTKAKYVIAGGAGSRTTPAGSKAVALALTAGQLVISPRRESTIRGRIPVDDTTFKNELAAAYDQYKQRKRQEVTEQRKRARTLAANDPAPAAPSAGTGGVTIQRGSKPSRALLAEYEAKIGPMPKRSADGTVALMVQSIRSGDVSEINPREISHWGPVRYELVDRQPYWTGTVTYKTTSLFGTFDTEAMALMRNGKVVSWVYTGSLEEVP